MIRKDKEMKNENNGKTFLFKKAKITGITILSFIVLLIIFNRKPVVDLNDYLEIDVTGYDGFGEASVHIDWDTIYEKYGRRIHYTMEGERKHGRESDIGGLTPVNVLSRHIKVVTDKTDSLSNGDTVEYQFLIDKEYKDVVACKIKWKDGKHKVKNLISVKTFDPFEDLSVSFSGIAPYGEIELSYEGDELDLYDFKCDAKNGFSNGDIVTIALDELNPESFIETYGKMPSTLEKKYTVEGLDSYRFSFENVGKNGLDNLKKQAEDVYRSDVAKNWTTASLDSLEYVGNYLLMNKARVRNDRNRIYLVYKVKSTIDYEVENKKFENKEEIYWFIQFEDIILEADGNIRAKILEYNTPQDKVIIEAGIASKKWAYFGYESLEELYEKVVTSNLAGFDYEDNCSK